MLLLEQLKQIPDDRGNQGKKYPLWLLRIIVIIGKFCGYDGDRDIAASSTDSAILILVTPLIAFLLHKLYLDQV